MKEIYTDGSCIGNPGPGGWGFVVDGGVWASGCDPETTNQRMELMAVIEAVERVGGKVKIFSDSEYVCNAFNKGWLASWHKKGWKKSDGNPPANLDMWQHLHRLSEKRTFELEWIKAHVGIRGNEVADRLAYEAARSQTGKQGKGDPFPQWDPKTDTENGKKRQFYGGEGKATDKQIKFAASLIEKSGQRPDRKELESMSKADISDLISRYKKD